ncbi:TPA: hypothetical protein ACTYTS_001626 [Enterobacter hormaechei]
MCKLLMDLQNELKSDIKIPDEIDLLYKLIESNGLVEAHDGLIQTPKGMVGDPTVYQYGRISAAYEFYSEITFTTSGQKGYG